MAADDPRPPSGPPAPALPPRQASDPGVDPAVFVTGPIVKPPTVSWFRRLAGLWGFAAFLLIVAYLFRSVLVPFIFALVVAYILAPAVQRISAWRLGRAHIPRGLAVLILYIVVLAGLGLFFVAFLPRLSADFVRFGREAPKIWERAQNEWTPIAARWLERHFPSLTPDAEPPRPPPPSVFTELPPPPGTVLTVTPMANGDYAITLPQNGIEIERVDEKRILVKQREVKPKHRLETLLRERMLRVLVGLEGQVAEVLRLGQVLVVGIFAALATLVVVLLVAAYLLIDIERVLGFARSVIPERYRLEYDAIMRNIDRGLNGVIRGQLLICLFNGVLTYVGLLIFQVKYGLLLAVIAGVLSAIPIFGTLLSSIPIVFLAVFTADDGFDLVRGLAVLAWIVGVHLTESTLFSPRILGASAKMHPVLVVFALIAGAETYGVVGAVLAVPMASIIQTLFLHFRARAHRLDAAASTSIPPLIHPPRGT